MLKVVIADDEQLIIAMMRKLIDWEAKELEIVGTADNGLALLDLIRTCAPDIVITDIRMPGLDGLTLIEQAMALQPGLDFIIISGYKNFEYAHQALKLGVRHYLLKPIDRQEMNQTLDRIIADRREQTQIRQELDETVRQNRDQVRRRFLNSILKETRLQTEDQKASDTDESLPFDENGSFQALMVKVDQLEREAPRQEIAALLEDVMSREQDTWGADYINAPVNGGVISIISRSAGAGEQRQAVRQAESLLSHCIREMDKFPGYVVTIGLGTIKGDQSQTRESVSEAVYAVKCRLDKGFGRVICYDALTYVQDSVDTIMSPDNVRGIVRAVDALDSKVVQADFQDMADTVLARPHRSPVLLYDLIDRYEQLMADAWTNNGVEPQIVKAFRDAVGEASDSCVNARVLVQEFRNICDAFFSSIIERRQKDIQAPVREARYYMQKHYSEDLSLDQVAAYCGLSPAYFSSLFKKEVGIGFSEYLINLRIDAAKKLLKESDDPMQAVSEKVGYTDTKYFSRIFKKTVGLKPSEYRKMYR